MSHHKQPTRQPQKVQSITHTQQQYYCGPVPDPDSLSKYEDIQPGFAHRLMAMAEKEQDERIKTNNLIIDNEKIMFFQDSKNLRRGQIFALLSVFMVVALCIFGFTRGYQKESRDIAVSVIAAIAGVFVTGKLFTRRKQNNNNS